MKVQTSVSVEEGLRNRVAEAAAMEGSSFSAMWALLVELGFTVRRPGLGRVGEETGPVEQKSLVVTAEPPAEAVSVLGRRTKKCVHQIPAETFCKWGCDPT